MCTGMCCRIFSVRRSSRSADSNLWEASSDALGSRKEQVASSKEIKKPKGAFERPSVFPCSLFLASCHFQNFIVPQSQNFCVSLEKLSAW